MGTSLKNMVLSQMQNKRLKDIAEPLKRFFGESAGLKEKLGPKD